MKNYKLNIPLVHGHMFEKDFYTFLSFKYENLNKTQTENIKYVFFKSENDKYNYWKFWTSEIGQKFISFWKFGINVSQKYIPYMWWQDEKDSLKYFNISEKDLNNIYKSFKDVKKYEEL